MRQQCHHCGALAGIKSSPMNTAKFNFGNIYLIKECYSAIMDAYTIMALPALQSAHVQKANPKCLRRNADTRHA
jgi:hypothetical protein